MPRLQVLVDGQPMYDGDVPQWTLPTMPTSFPDALNSNGSPTTPLARIMFIRALLELFKGLLIQHGATGLTTPQVTVNTDTTDQFTLTVTTPLGHTRA